MEEACPHAALVYDLFYAVAKFSREVINRVRVDESNQRDEAGRQLIKGSRYLLLTNAEHLVRDQRGRLDALLAANHNLHTVYVCSKTSSNAPGPTAGQGGPVAHRCSVRVSRGERAASAPDLRQESLAPRRRHLINHCRYVLHTGRLEGINNKIKVIKRTAYGFRDDGYFILKIKGAFPGDMHQNPR